jgi:hypothetical protein
MGTDIAAASGHKDPLAALFTVHFTVDEIFIFDFFYDFPVIHVKDVEMSVHFIVSLYKGNKCLMAERIGLTVNRCSTADNYLIITEFLLISMYNINKITRGGSPYEIPFR